MLCLFTGLRSNDDLLLKIVASPSDWSDQPCNNFPYSTLRALNTDFRRRIQRLVGGQERFAEPAPRGEGQRKRSCLSVKSRYAHIGLLSVAAIARLVHCRCIHGHSTAASVSRINGG